MTTIVMPDGERGEAEVLHLSPRGLYAVVKLAGTPHKGTVGVFHVSSGKRATRPQHLDQVRTQKVARAVADALDEYDPVTDDGTLRVLVEEYRGHLDTLVKELS